MKASAIVTGGSGGLGVAVVDELLAAGWRVVVPGTRRRNCPGCRTHPGWRRCGPTCPTRTTPATAVARAAGAPDAPLRAVVNLVGGFGDRRPGARDAGR